MQQKVKYKMLSTMCAVILLFVAGGDASMAAEIATEIDSANGQWPLAAWYGFSVVLALIGYMAAKSKN